MIEGLSAVMSKKKYGEWIDAQRSRAASHDPIVALRFE